MEITFEAHNGTCAVHKRRLGQRFGALEYLFGCGKNAVYVVVWA